MKLCIVGGASSIHLQKRAKWFAEKGIDVHVISSTQASIEGVSYYKIGKKEGSVLNFIKKIIQTKRLVKKIKPDILVAHYAFGPGTFAACTNFHPFVIRCMGTDIGTDSEKSFIQKTLVKFALRKADLVFVLDECAKKRVVELGCKEEKTAMQPSFCNTKIFSPKSRSENIRRELDIEDKPSVIYARNIERKYKADVLKNAIPKVIRELPNVRFIIVEKGDSLDEFKSFIKSNNLQKNIIFLPYIPNKDFAKYLASVDLYVDTFYSEYDVGGHGHGTNTVEAMSCGCPQLLPDRKEYKGPDFHAILYNRGNSRDMADKMVMMLKDNDLRNSISKKSRESAISFADEEKVMNNVLDNYKRLNKHFKVK
jgi:L-malate glycosyltransferase